jgi:hypothetical protein
MKFSTIVLSVALGSTSAFTSNYAKLSRPSGSMSATLERVEETTATPAVVTSPVESSMDNIAMPLKTIDQVMQEETTSVDNIMP